jgi:hypothetical protein
MDQERDGFRFTFPEEEDERYYNLSRAWFSFLLVCLQQISSGWVVRELTSMNSYKSQENFDGEEYYKLGKLPGYD